MCIPYPTEAHFETTFLFKELSEHYGLTVFGLAFKNMGPDDVSYVDRQKCYYYPESGSHATYRDALKEICRRYGFKEHRIFVYGLSGGGTAASILAHYQPDLVAGLVSMSGRRMDPAQSISVPTFLSHTFSDDVQLTETNELLAEAMTKAGNPPMHVIGMPDWPNRGHPYFAHGADQRVASLAGAFIRDLAARADPGTGTVPQVASWPFSCNTSKPTELFDSSRVSAAAMTNRTFFPTRELYQQWLACQHQWITEASTNRCMTAIAVPPPIQNPKGLVVMIGDGESLTAPDKRDLMFLADSGYISVYREGGFPGWTAKGLGDLLSQHGINLPDKIYIIARDLSISHVQNTMMLHPRVLALRYHEGEMIGDSFRMLIGTLGSQETRIVLGSEHFPQGAHPDTVIVTRNPGKSDESSERRNHFALVGDIAEFSQK